MLFVFTTQQASCLVQRSAKTSSAILCVILKMHIQEKETQNKRVSGNGYGNNKRRKLISWEEKKGAK